MDRKRSLLFYKHYFSRFFEAQTVKVQEKIDYVLFLIITAERIPQKFFAYVKGTNGLFEIRIEIESNIYRIFCCFDEGDLVVLFNAFQKKTRKTPLKEIDRAIRLKNEYFNIKSKIYETGK
jgi:phage-related protein